MVVAWSTFGPHPIGCERFLTVSNGLQRSPAVSSGRSFAQVAGAILRKQARGQNPDKDEVPRFMAGLRGHHQHGPSFVLLMLAVNGPVRTL
jgi:hypothetical protein